MTEKDIAILLVRNGIAKQKREPDEYTEANEDENVKSLPEIAKIINQSRIPAVHAKERIPVPSREQAVMVIHAVADTVNRAIISP